MATRDEIRAATLGASHPKEVVMVKWGDVEIGVRELTRTERRVVLDQARDDEGRGVDMEKLESLAVIACCIDEEGAQAFDGTDLECMLSQPLSGFMKELADVAMKLLDIVPPKKDPRKNSETTQTES